jgi:hypothetical protein
MCCKSREQRSPKRARVTRIYVYFVCVFWVCRNDENVLCIFVCHCPCRTGSWPDLKQSSKTHTEICNKKRPCMKNAR